MTPILILLAIPGALAVFLRFGKATLRAAKYSLERYVARQIVDQRAGRGDITGMEEANRLRSAAATYQMRYLGEALLWAALLGLPLIFPPAIVLYPFYSIFWFI